uniref:Knl1 C-terminal RWD domain-containing protein n=2 Tax=Salarias fasciatus TaxID=181472 RepID=A0A672IWY1_SALFA
MKEVLYFKLLHALKEEQQKLRGTIEKADEMLKSLDDCIHELQTELAGVEENGFDSKPSMKSLLEEMKKASETMDDNERQISELELQKKQNSSKLKRLNSEIQSLESHMDMLDILNEWKLKEKRDDGTVYTFLHETMSLQLTFEKSDGNLADSESERKITQIRFNFELDDEKSQCHARLVHKLVSQFVEAEPAWAEKFPTSRHVPKLLHAVSLVVSRCRLLGEECRRLKLWGSLPFDILRLSCSDTRISIVFSSLRKCSKFEVVFAVSLSNRLCVLQVESFKNRIGSTTMSQIEEIVSSCTPTKNLLTKIAKKIHDTLLC